MSWWQTKLTSYALRYVISTSGLLDERCIDPSIYGRVGVNSEIELKNVGVNVDALRNFAELPPGLRIETARVLLLRARIPPDLWQSSIDVHIDGLELLARLEAAPESCRKEQEAEQGKSESRTRAPASASGPPHRKVPRRRHSPPPRARDESRLHFPSTHDMAVSFLQHEPADERRDMEAALPRDEPGMEESLTGESSQGPLALRTGPSLPSFLSRFIRGMQDRLQAHLDNIDVKLMTDVQGDGGELVPVTLRLRLPKAHVQPLPTKAKTGDERGGEKRQITLSDVTLDVLSDATVFADLPGPPTRPSSAAADNKARESPDQTTASVTSPTMDSSTTSAASSPHLLLQHGLPTFPTHAAVRASAAETTATASPPSDPLQSTMFHSTDSTHPSLDIQPGDDNISWGSRRSHVATPAPQDLWSSMTSEDDLSDSLRLARASPPRAHMSRSSSPTATRTRRALSPYDRTLQSPGSWPRPTTPEKHPTHQSPGSWPTLDPSPRSILQPPTPGPEDPMDNKPPAVERSVVSPGSHLRARSDHGGDSRPEPTDEQIDDLAHSKMYSHEDAESMYMSAMTHTPKMAIPGGWDRDDDHGVGGSVRSDVPELQLRTVDGASESRHARQEHEPGPRPSSGNDPPRAPSPEPRRKDMSDLAAKRLLAIDEIVFSLPNERPQQGADLSPSSCAKPQASTRSRRGQGVPGASTSYSELTGSRRQRSSSTFEEERSVLGSPKPAASDAIRDQAWEVRLGSLDVTTDLACLQLLWKAGLLAADAMRIKESVGAQEKTAKQPTGPMKSMPISGSIDKIRVALFEKLQHTHEHFAETELVALHCQDVDVSTSHGDGDVRLGRFTAFISGSELLAFDRDGVMKTSIIPTEHTPDIAAMVSTSRVTAMGRSITDITVETLPLKLELDMCAIDDTLSSFGGISGLLELSTSMLLEDRPKWPAVASTNPTKGVRFRGDPSPLAPKRTEIKINGNLGGADVLLRGDACAVSLRTTKIKTIYREAGSSATVAHVILSGPHVERPGRDPLTIDAANVKFDFLNTPTEKDVERLISLVSPSKDKYDGDDVLIDTLTRQRHKGSLTRIGVGDIKAEVVQWECLKPLTALGGELSKLSAVAKYLPDDDRPGLLTLVRVRSFEAQMPINERFGKLQVTGQDLHCAHVGAPPLLAVALGTVHVERAGHALLLHPVTATTNGNGDALPMLMVRNLGEAEPVVKIKFFNTLVDYSVPTVLALTNVDLPKEAQGIVVDLAQSVAQLTRTESRQRLQMVPGEESSASEKRTRIDVLIHDSAVGLQPEGIGAKGMLVLSDARFSTMLPPESSMAGSLELRRAALFATDDAASAPEESPLSRRSPSNESTDAKLAAALSQEGYISLGSIRSMKLTAHVEGADADEKSVEIDVSSELLLLETCADSTQTLFAILGGLTPPTAPSTEPKYRMQPMTIEDMMASFTGEPEKEPAVSLGPEMLFDAEDDQGLEPPKSPQASLMPDDNDDLLLASGMSASVYGPLSGMLGGVDELVDDEEQISGNFDETAESLLEEDPFEMTMAPGDMAMGDAALVRELNKQSKPAMKSEPVDLGSHEIEDLGFDALTSGQQALGSQHRFARPIIKSRNLAIPHAQKKPPLRLRLRDSNVLWHLHDGYDWRKTRDGITHGFEAMEQRHEERMARRRVSAEAREDDEDIIGDVLFNSIYIHIPSNQDPQDLRRQMNRAIDDTVSETESQAVSNMSRPTQYSAPGRPIRQTRKRRLKIERSRTHKVSMELHSLCADVSVFPPGDGDVNSSVDVKVKDFEIYDNLSTSTWKKFLTSLDQGVKDREMAKPMVHLDIANVKTLQDYSASELTIHASLLPLRLHVDQDCLDFIVRFFSFKDDAEASASPKQPDEQPFLQRLEVDTVDIRLDYKPKRVDYALLRSGKTGELINFAALDSAPIRLKHTIVYGLRGFEPIHQTLNDIWMPDVVGRQLPRIVAGVSAVRHLSNLGAGVRDVVAVPVREWKRDGRVVRSVAKGVGAFGRVTGSELARLGAKIAIGTGNMLQGAEGVLSPPQPASREGEWQDVEGDAEPRAISSYANQPLGVFSGLRAARRNLERDLLTARDAFIAVQGEVLESAGPGGVVRAVGRYAPVVLLRPVIGATRAVGHTLLGVGNAIDMEGARRVEDKYKKR